MILHIGAYSSKHIMFPFIEFVHQYFNEDEHFYILCSSDKIKLPYKNTITKDIFKEQKYFIDMMNKADKIILHGVWYEEIPKIYLENKILFGKTLWAIWGGDYHCVDTISNEKKWLYENIKYIISGNKFSFDTLKRNYKINAKLLNCFLYPSNLVKSNFPRARCHDKTINIQIGNSANPTNRHLEAFEYIKHIKNHNIMIYCPLSYGNREYANQIIRKGKELFKDKFMAVEKVLSFDEYIKFLHTIDIGIFNHQKQEVFKNLTYLKFQLMKKNRI